MLFDDDRGCASILFFFLLSECDWGRADDKDENARETTGGFGNSLDKRVLNSPFKEERTFRVYKTREKSWTRERHRARARVRRTHESTSVLINNEHYSHCRSFSRNIY